MARNSSFKRRVTGLRGGATGRRTVDGLARRVRVFFMAVWAGMEESVIVDLTAKFAQGDHSVTAPDDSVDDPLPSLRSDGSPVASCTSTCRSRGDIGLTRVSDPTLLMLARTNLTADSSSCFARRLNLNLPGHASCHFHCRPSSDGAAQD